MFFEATGPTGEVDVPTSIGQGTRGVEEKESYLFFLRPPQSPSDSYVPVGGRLGNFLSQWTTTTSSQFILDIIENGYKLEFNSIPSPSFQVTQGSGEGRSYHSVRGIGGSEGSYAGTSEGMLPGSIFPRVRGEKALGKVQVD